MMDQNLCLVLTTVKEARDADHIGSQLVEQSMAACVQIDGPIRSIYRWQGEMCVDQEYRLVIKTSHARWNTLQEYLSEIHPYEEPEIICIPIDRQSEGYGNWVLNAVLPSRQEPNANG